MSDVNYKKCKKCLANYFGKHQCDGLMKMLVDNVKPIIEPTEITREEADRILVKMSHGTEQRCVLCYAGKWYDIRGMSDKALLLFQSKLTGIPIDEIYKKTANISL